MWDCLHARMIRGLVSAKTALAATLLIGCVDQAADGVEIVETAGDTLTGDFLFETTFEGSEGDCPDPVEVERRGREAYARGRIGTRSQAYLGCISAAVATGLPRIMTEGGNTGQLGPFKPCSFRADCDLPWLRSATPAERQAWFLTMASSPLKLRMRCDGRTSLGGDQGGFMVKNSDGIPEGIEGLRLGIIGTNPNKSAGLIWHEVTHNHACGIHPHWDACGYSSSGQYDAGDNATTGIIGGCLSEVLQQSAASSSCASLSCAAGEQAIIREYGETACECVPDVFAWPDNGNESNDTFGYALATGDFNGDGYDDLAVGTPGEGSHRGVVYLFRGSPRGLLHWKRFGQADITAINYQAMPPTPFAPGHAAYDHFGWALAAGDLDADGADELAVGTPNKNFGAGIVYILRGGPSGPSLTNVEYLDQTANGGSAESGDLFGSALAIGKFNDDSYEDLAVGAPDEVYGGNQSGIVSIHRGRVPPTTFSSIVVSEGFIDQAPAHSNEDGDEFGITLSTGNIDGDSLDELIISAPGENSGQGYIFVAERAPGWTISAALTSAGALRFGSSLAVGDIVGSSHEDIVVGSPSDQGLMGRVWIYRGRSGFPAFTVQLTGDETDAFGDSLAIANVRGTSKRDLIVGAPGERFGSGPPEGRSLVYVGTTSDTFPTAWDGYIYQGDFIDAGSTDTAMPPLLRASDRFGQTAAVGNFNGAGIGVVVGAPFDEVDGATGAGSIFTFSPTLVAGRNLNQRTTRYSSGAPPH